MGHREDMLDVIRSAYAARGRGDANGLVAAFHREGVFTLVGDNSALELTGSAQGHPTLQAAFGQFIANFEFVERDILDELVDGERAAVRSRLLVRYVPTGKTFSTEVLDLFRFQDGKIIELIEFADTAQIKAVIS
ncbi:nuclear transport factor 2 family protein [Bradyrhizobium sp. CCGUVB1N3]|uniref:nuclear transport factor 2 family protein n=1 Tax=Bradyrhizobium sp. CCGUVB1N3 TaxID=2949629 RepID=UPI0020B44258|nr:nuclear transport factor 2 family protein [Bradyrhizobium sp. CCGUVB1N3]MCP3473408.1 nuclear transport factor 2 family protein [Bradyrhizobium sp. CCGUVB1N3]